MISGCTSNQPPFKPGYSKHPSALKKSAKFHPRKGRPDSPASRQAHNGKPEGQVAWMAKKNPRKAGHPPLSSPSPDKKILLPTIINIKDRSLMVFVNSGVNRMSLLNLPRGTPRLDKLAFRSKNSPVFYMDQLEITVDQYKKFDGKYDEKPFIDDRECPHCPAMGIDWTSANRYCLWAGKRLPTEEEWVAAASGGSNNLWPWGNKFSPGKANLWGDEDGSIMAAPVGSYPEGASPYGLLDTVGNVWEWVSTPYFSSNKGPEKKILRIVKGGGWTSNQQVAGISFRNIVDPAMKNPTIGFRCAKSI